MSFQLLNYYPAIPGCCKSCGNSTRMPIIDMGWSEEFHGAVYLCMTCLEEMASTAGFYSEESVQKIKDKSLQRKRKVEELELEKSINGNLLAALEPHISKLRDELRSEYKERFANDLATSIERITKDAEVERQLFVDDLESRADAIRRLAVLDYEAEQAKLKLDASNESAESGTSESVSAREPEAIESGSVEESGDIYSLNYPGAPIRKLNI